MIKAKNIHKYYDNLHVLKGIDLEVNSGEIISIVGSSGAGKTTLLQILGTIDKADKGTLHINNEKIDQLNNKELAKFRNQSVGFVFQFHNLLPEFNALENICLPGYIAKSPKNEVEKKANELLSILNLKDRSLHKPNELSGGEQQRVAVARALINNPGIILADEPSGNLDSKNADELHKMFLKLNKEFNQTFIIVTHNQNLADMTNRKLVMQDGLFIK
tara:strand:- start:306 stop:959 length:654 start_codon:yes stop_codon:yes gene_type:complete